MKKLAALLICCYLLLSLSGCGLSDTPISTTRPLPNYDPSVSSTDETENQTEEDERDEPEILRQEIAKMLRDAEDLINEGLFDDAKMVLRDLRSRDLTGAEKERVNELLSRLVTISD